MAVQLACCRLCQAGFDLVLGDLEDPSSFGDLWDLPVEAHGDHEKIPSYPGDRKALQWEEINVDVIS